MNMVHKHAYSNILLLLHSAFMLCVVRMLLKEEVGGSALNNHGNYIVDRGKSWNCVFKFLWEPWRESAHMCKQARAFDIGIHKLWM